VTAYDPVTQQAIANFFAFPVPNPGGVRVATADRQGTGLLASILTAPGPGLPDTIQLFGSAPSFAAGPAVAVFPGSNSGLFIA
jgi:hypothetical protein